MDQQGDITTPCSAPVEGQSAAPSSSSKGGPEGFDFSAPSHIAQSYDGRARGYPFLAPFRAQERSCHLCLFREHFAKCIRGPSGASLEVYAGPYRHTTHLIIP